jgi:hypothetical protein
VLLSIETVIADTPVPGISPHLHICVVRREGISLRPNDRTIYSEPVREFVMPPVATSLNELVAHLDRRAPALAGAEC